VLRRRPCVMCNYEKNKKTTFKGVSVTVCGLRRHASRASFFALFLRIVSSKEFLVLRATFYFSL